MRIVAKLNPKTKTTDIDLKKASARSGNTPRTVVSAPMVTGRKRLAAESNTA